MHEIAISETILKVIAAEAKKRDMKKLRSAKLKIGRMKAFQKDNLVICLKGYGNNSALSGMDFEIIETPVKLECDSCHKKFGDPRFDELHFAHSISHAPEFYVPPACPDCGSSRSKVVEGNEMELVSISD